LAEEATLDTREAKKDKKVSHTDRPGMSKCNDNKRKNHRSASNVEQPHHNRTEYQPRPDEYESFLDGICIFHSLGKHEIWDWNQSTKKVEQEKKTEDLKNNFPEAHNEVNYIFSEPDSYESKRKLKLTALEVMAVSPGTPEHLKWSEVPITFDQSNHSNFIPKPSWYPLIVSPIIKDVKLKQVLIDGGSSLNILFLKTFN
jgi:hypothetical protein